MDVPAPAPLAVGDVIRNRSASGIVWQIQRRLIGYVPLVAQRIPRHRAELAVSDLAELAGLGVAFREGAVARCHTLHNVRPARVVRIGRASPALMARVAAAMVREAQTRAIEQRLHHMRPGD